MLQFAVLLLIGVLLTPSACSIQKMSSTSPTIAGPNCRIRGHCQLPDGFVYLEDYYKENINRKVTELPSATSTTTSSSSTGTSLLSSGGTSANDNNVHGGEIHQIRECLRYATEENFSGQIVRGYGNGSRAVTTIATAEALYKAQKLANEHGYSLIVYDSYRPKKAVDFFVQWGKEPDNCPKCRANYFPDIEKKSYLFLERDRLHPRYIAPNSRHSAGNTVDLSLIRLGQSVVFPPIPIERQLKNNLTVNYLFDNSLDMYTSFDLLSPASWPLDGADLIPKEFPLTFYKNRMLLRDIMVKANFVPLESEWWHFSLNVTSETTMDFEF